MRSVLVAVAGLLLSGQAALAQDICPGGHVIVVRTSKLKPGQAALFAKAVLDQQAWYRSHGMTANQQLFGPVYKAGAAESGEMITLHMDAPTTRLTTDAAWNAFVKEFRDSSDMITETRACVRAPK